MRTLRCMLVLQLDVPYVLHVIVSGSCLALQTSAWSLFDVFVGARSYADM